MPKSSKSRKGVAPKRRSKPVADIVPAPLQETAEGLGSFAEGLLSIFAPSKKPRSRRKNLQPITASDIEKESLRPKGKKPRRLGNAEADRLGVARGSYTTQQKGTKRLLKRFVLSKRQAEEEIGSAKHGFGFTFEKRAAKNKAASKLGAQSKQSLKDEYYVHRTKQNIEYRQVKRRGAGKGERSASVPVYSTNLRDLQRQKFPVSPELTALDRRHRTEMSFNELHYFVVVGELPDAGAVVKRAKLLALYELTGNIQFLKYANYYLSMLG